jgi:hypothetical protein
MCKIELILKLERVGGVGPPSSAWKADIIAVILHPPKNIAHKIDRPIITKTLAPQARVSFAKMIK